MKKSKHLVDMNKKIQEIDFDMAGAVNFFIDNKKSKFDETLEISMNLGIDPRHADQMVRGVVSLPNGNGKKMRVAVFAKDEKAKEATEAGADIVDGAIDAVAVCKCRGCAVWCVPPPLPLSQSVWSVLRRLLLLELLVVVCVVGGVVCPWVSWCVVWCLRLVSVAALTRSVVLCRVVPHCRAAWCRAHVWCGWWPYR